MRRLLGWEDDRAEYYGVMYILQSETVRHEGTHWWVHVHEVPGKGCTRTINLTGASKAQARAAAERDSRSIPVDLMAALKKSLQGVSEEVA